ncbi:MAG: SH3 domain-containing protein [Brevinematales bacterium]|nr:SH3 domain-containing protein [Brevinematales bacterium]
MRTYLGILWMIASFCFATERDYLSPDVGFVSIVSWKAFLYDAPNGQKKTQLSALQSVEVIAKTNLSPHERWYQVLVRSLTSGNEHEEKGWVHAKDLFSEKDLQMVKKIPEWYLFVEFGDHEWLVCHVLTQGRIRAYEKNHTYEDQLKMYHSIFSLGRTMLYYDGTNASVPWAQRFEIITNHILFPHEDDLFSSLGSLWELTGDRVNLRSFPSTNAQVVTQLSKGTEVVFLWRVGKKEKIAGKSGYWARIIVFGKKRHDGYLFDAYLKRKTSR